MNEKQDMRIVVNGYVCEILCGQIPRACKDGITGYLREHRDESKAPRWIQSRNPNYVSPEEIKGLWYDSEGVMVDLMASCGFFWEGFRRINDLHHLQGFGSGKEGVGIFDMSVLVEERLVAEFVPFDPPEDTGDRFHNLLNIPQRERDPLQLPQPNDQMVAISSGSWAKGTMEFHSHTGADFDPASLAITIVDATPIGIGEDHLVTGLRYEDRDLSSRIVREVEKDMYPVSWYSPEQSRWLDMYEE
jgi:hypothetical protein